MKNCFTIVKSKFKSACNTAFENLNIEPNITVANAKFGDYQCNSPMAIFKEHGKNLGLKSPKEVGEQLTSSLEMDMFSQVTVAPQGFVTVKVSDQWLLTQLKTGLNSDLIQKPSTPRKIALDFSSPNIAKELHVGHLRSTILGDSLARVAERLGHTVLRLNHIGDWGTQFGMLIEFMKEEYPQFEEELPPMSALLTLYQNSKKRFDSDPEFKKRAQLNVVDLQAGNKATLRAWSRICELSRTDFNELYTRLDVKITEMGESFYNPIIPTIITKLEELRISQMSNNAVCIFTSIDKVPLMLVKSDGGYGYDSTDMAAIWYRLNVLKCDWLIYVTDLGQETHFHKIFDAAKQAGWFDPKCVKVAHVGFGVIKGEDGKRLKTRSGEVIKLKSLIDEAVTRAKNELIKRNDERVDGAGANVNIDFAAEVIGTAAIKYFDLKQNRLTDYQFSFENMLDSKGNTAVYLLYAYARICSVFRKSGKDISDLNQEEMKLSHPNERALALCIARLPEVLDDILNDYYLHRLTEYVYDLSVKFSDFYSKCRILGEHEQSRLLLSHLTKLTFEECFVLLGIKKLEHL